MLFLLSFNYLKINFIYFFFTLNLLLPVLVVSFFSLSVLFPLLTSFYSTKNSSFKFLSFSWKIMLATNSIFFCSLSCDVIASHASNPGQSLVRLTLKCGWEIVLTTSVPATLRYRLCGTDRWWISVQYKSCVQSMQITSSTSIPSYYRQAWK